MGRSPLPSLAADAKRHRAESQLSSQTGSHTLAEPPPPFSVPAVLMGALPTCLHSDPMSHTMLVQGCPKRRVQDCQRLEELN